MICSFLFEETPMLETRQSSEVESQSTPNSVSFPTSYDPSGEKFLTLFKLTLQKVKQRCRAPLDCEEIAMELTCRAFTGVYTKALDPPPQSIAPVIIHNYCIDQCRHLRLERSKLQTIHETDRIKDISDNLDIDIPIQEVLNKVKFSSFECAYIYHRFYNGVNNSKELSKLIGINEDRLQTLQSNLFFKIRQKIQELKLAEQE
jgi:DNA-directed RNA polymerase specialized sigma24 family protein